jgi:hypothetical protein
MPELVERVEIAPSVFLSSGGNRFAIARLGLFLQLQYDDSGRRILQCCGQPTEPLNSFFKQFGHTKIITCCSRRCRIDSRTVSFRKKHDGTFAAMGVMSEIESKAELPAVWLRGRE